MCPYSLSSLFLDWMWPVSFHQSAISSVWHCEELMVQQLLSCNTKTSLMASLSLSSNMFGHTQTDTHTQNEWSAVPSSLVLRECVCLLCNEWHWVSEKAPGLCQTHCASVYPPATKWDWLLLWMIAFYLITFSDFSISFSNTCLLHLLKYSRYKTNAAPNTEPSPLPVDHWQWTVNQVCVCIQRNDK